MSTDVDALWPEVQARLRSSVPERAYRLYLADLEPIALTDDALVLVAHRDRQRWVQARFGRVLRNAVRDVTGRDLNIDMRERGAVVPSPPRTLHASGDHPEDVPLGGAHHCFEHFVIGAGNRLAHAAALAVAEQPSQAYNPLVLCGSPGVGKTHLLGAVVRYVQRHGGGLTARYVSGEAFGTEFRAALHTHSMDRFKARYRGVDLLALDDAQFFSGMARTQEELAHTLAALEAAGSQIVLAADRPPVDLTGLDLRVRELLGRGLVCELDTPDRATRLGILRQRAQQDAIAIADPAVLELLAAEQTDDVRVLEGALVRAVALASLRGQPLDVDGVRIVLAGLRRRGASRGDPVEAVQEAAARAFGVTREELLSRNRAARLAWPRHVAMYLARELSDQSLPAIGRRFGGRNHATVLNAWRQTAARIAADPEACRAVDELRRSLSGPSDASA